ncbi:MAG: v-ubq [Candidatus Midichloriaceae bacterium]|jgi:hypothetical protein|nr:v-ubq [Candidatus Midichloriaceae bacterium]
MTKLCVYVKTLTGKSLRIEADSEDTISSVKEKVAELMLDPQEYHEFEYYTNHDPLTDSLRLLFAGKQLEDKKRLEDYNNIVDNSTLHAVRAFRQRNYSLKVTCIANNVKFTTFIKYSEGEPCTSEQLKTEFLKFTSLTCTAIYLKKRGVEELCEFKGENLPLKDLYVTLDGDINIGPRTDNLRLYISDSGQIEADVNECKVSDERNSSFFSKPKSESIVRLDPEQRKNLINCVGTINALPTANKLSPNQYDFSNIAYRIITGAIYGAGGVLFSRLAQGAMFNSLSTTALHLAIGAIGGAAIGYASGYVYENCFKPQDISIAKTV